MARVLIVEDEPDVLQMLTEQLQRRTQHEILQAPHATQGIKLAQEQSPHLILMDVNFNTPPNGIEATRQLKSQAATRNIGVVIMSGYGDKKFLDQAFAAGCDDFWQKMPDVSELVAKIERLLELLIDE